MKTLFKVRIRRLKNAIRYSGRRKYIIFSIFGLSIIFLLGFLFTRIFGYLYSQEEFPLYFKLFLSEKILMMFFLTMFVMLIMSALISSLNIFFLSRDLNLLISSPLKIRTVFLWVWNSSDKYRNSFNNPQLKYIQKYFLEIKWILNWSEANGSCEQEVELMFQGNQIFQVSLEKLFHGVVSRDI